MRFSSRFTASRLHFRSAAGSQRSPLRADDVTNTDIQRLQDSIDDASRDVAQLRGARRDAATQLQAELDDLRDEAIYLKVKLRKNEPIARSEYADVRDRIEDIRSRARGDSSGGSRRRRRAGARRPTTDANRAEPSTTGRSQNATRFLSAPSSTCGCRHRSARRPRRSKIASRRRRWSTCATRRPRHRAGRLGDARRRQLGQQGDAHRSQGQPDRRLRSRHDQRPRVSDARHGHAGARERRHQGRGGKDRHGAGVGAIIGAILGGAKGALAGILIGGGGTIAATEGKDVELPAGTVLRVRLDSPLNLR